MEKKGSRLVALWEALTLFENPDGIRLHFLLVGSGNGERIHRKSIRYGIEWSMVEAAVARRHRGRKGRCWWCTGNEAAAALLLS